MEKWNINKLPYQRGFIYALYLYQTYGNKFLNRYKKLVKTVNKLRKHEKYKMVNNNLFKQILNDNKFNDYIINGKTIEIKSSTYIGDIPHVKINDIFWFIFFSNILLYHKSIINTYSKPCYYLHKMHSNW